MSFHWSKQGNFKPQLEMPKLGNPYYNTRSNGGYSTAIEGQPVVPRLNVLANCVGYAYGRYNELWGDKTMPYLKPIDAGLWYNYASAWGLKTSEEPVPGAIMRFGINPSTLPNGHVCIVEEILWKDKDGKARRISTSNSYFISDPFMVKYYTRSVNGTYTWTTDIPHAIVSTFQGFILPPEKKKAQGVHVTTSRGRNYGG